MHELEIVYFYHSKVTTNLGVAKLPPRVSTVEQIIEKTKATNRREIEGMTLITNTHLSRKGDIMRREKEELKNQECISEDSFYYFKN